ncbi:MmpS family transport accessory protein [Nocardia sp. NPDC004568]|uniref:MmpS family transport accessory protein n=1 Tax=Nocardia sp. NPDC004568 TaxID=3154551 RepID=UPI0033B5FC7C
MIDPPGEHRHRSGMSPAPADRQDLYAGTWLAGTRSARRWTGRPWVGAAIVLVVLCLTGGCLAMVAGIADQGDGNSDREVAVSYEVEGTAGDVSITYLGHDLGMTRETAAALPWRRDVLIESFGTMVSLIAVKDAGGGAVTCRILIGGRLVSEQTSTGSYASAGCSGNAGGT